MKAIIFSGGVGKRLWPLSRTKTPKQFMNYVHKKTMLQLAVERVLPEFGYNDIYIVTGKVYKNNLKKQVPELPSENMILEPQMRDVGPAVGLVAAIFAKKFPSEPIAILWGSDHLVKKPSKFRQMLRVGEKIVVENPQQIVFYGQKPRFASVNVGWIGYGESSGEIDGTPIYKFMGWKYRPDQKTSNEFFKKKTHTWNTGYYVTTSTNLWRLFEQFTPKLYSRLKKIQDAVDTSDFQKVLNKIYPTLEKIHFDNAILEKIDYKKAVVINEDYGWSDVGAWEQLKEALESSKETNVTRGNVVLEDSTDNLVFNYDSHKLIVGIDLNDFLVVNTPDAMLVTKKTSVPKIRKVVKLLQETKYKHHT